MRAATLGAQRKKRIWTRSRRAPVVAAALQKSPRSTHRILPTSLRQTVQKNTAYGPTATQLQKTTTVVTSAKKLFQRVLQCLDAEFATMMFVLIVLLDILAIND